MPNLVEFFDSHDIGDDWAHLPAAEFQVNRRRRQKRLRTLSEERAEKLNHLASARRVSSEALLPSWLREKLARCWNGSGGRQGNSRTRMPVISMFYGIVVSLYFMDARRHKRPHVHVRYQDREAVLSIPDGDVLEGRCRRQR
jgi:hypothetical protein